MRIISKIRDYYDAQAYMYGVDELIVFDRTKLLPPTVDVYIPDEDPFRLYNGTREKQQEIQLDGHTLKIGYTMILSVCGKPFLIGQTETLYEGMQYHSPVIVKPQLVLLRHEPKVDADRPAWRRPTFKYGQPYRFLERIHKQIGSPIFIVYGEENNRKLSQQVHRYLLTSALNPVPTPIPNLSQIRGLAKVYTGQQIYQDISYYIANILNESPDVQPVGAPPQTDPEKIVAHGLDLKQSFRHRK